MCRDGDACASLARKKPGTDVLRQAARVSGWKIQKHRMKRITEEKGGCARMLRGAAQEKRSQGSSPDGVKALLLIKRRKGALGSTESSI